MCFFTFCIFEIYFSGNRITSLSLPPTFPAPHLPRYLPIQPPLKVMASFSLIPIVTMYTCTHTHIHTHVLAHTHIVVHMYMIYGFRDGYTALDKQHKAHSEKSWFFFFQQSLVLYLGVGPRESVPHPCEYVSRYCHCSSLVRAALSGRDCFIAEFLVFWLLQSFHPLFRDALWVTHGCRRCRADVSTGVGLPRSVDLSASHPVKLSLSNRC